MDEPVRGDEEVRSADEIGSGLRFLLSELRAAWEQLVQETAASDESVTVVRNFKDSVAEVAQELGSYVDAKSQFPSASANVSEYDSRARAVDDLHARKARLLKKVELLHQQCQRGALGEAAGKAPKQRRRVQGQ
jgi:hypothetical protein